MHPDITYVIPNPSQGTSSPRVKMAVPLSVKIVPHRHAQSPSARWVWILSSWQLIPTITHKNLTSMPLHQAPLKCPSLSCWICLRIGVAWATHTLFMYPPQLTCTPGGSQPVSTDQKSTQSSHGDSMYSLIPYYEETLYPSWGTLAYTLAVAAWGSSIIWLTQRWPSPWAHFKCRSWDRNWWTSQPCVARTRRVHCPSVTPQTSSPRPGGCDPFADQTTLSQGSHIRDPAD